MSGGRPLLELQTMWDGELPSPTAELCNRYFEAIEAADFDSLAALMTPDARVASPLYGDMPALDFHRLFFADTRRVRPERLGHFEQAGGLGAAAHVRWDWTLEDEQRLAFEAVDLFELSDDGRRIRRLAIVYDTAASREAIERLRRRRLEAAVAAVVAKGD